LTTKAGGGNTYQKLFELFRNGNKKKLFHACSQRFTFPKCLEFVAGMTSGDDESKRKFSLAV
jgi:hypothetical protein